MSKNTLSSAFRKLDIDQYDTEKYNEDDAVEPQSPPIGPDEREINVLIAQGKYVDALLNILQNSPCGAKNQAVRDSAHNQMMKVLLSIKSSAVEEAVNAVPKHQIDLLMKYIYRGFESPADGSSGHLLLWHEKVFDKGGLGCIVRVLTDKKKV